MRGTGFHQRREEAPEVGSYRAAAYPQAVVIRRAGALVIRMTWDDARSLLEDLKVAFDARAGWGQVGEGLNFSAAELKRLRAADEPSGPKVKGRGKAITIAPRRKRKK